jgi:glycosyltransferase involved in cell wall biosynthesis
MTTMKIVVVTPYFAPAWSYGGPPRVLFTLCKELVRRGHTVTVLTTDSLGSIRAKKLEERTRGVVVRRFRTISNWLAYKMKIFYVPRFGAQVAPFISSADFVLCSDTRSLLNLQISESLHRLRIPYAVFPYGQVPYDAAVKAVFKQVLDSIWVRRFFLKASLIFAQTDHERKIVHHHFDLSLKNVKILPLPIEKNIQDRNRVNFRKKYAIPAHAKIVLFVGRFHRLKGLEFLVSIFKSLWEKDKNIFLVLIGRDDGYLAHLKHQL